MSSLSQVVKEVSDSDWNSEVLESERPVIVDLWAPWCGPCRVIAPELQILANERPDLKIVKLNIDESPSIAEKYGVMSIPTIILFKDGQEAGRVVGAMRKDRIISSFGLEQVKNDH